MRKWIVALTVAMAMVAARAGAESTNSSGNVILRQNVTHVLTDDVGTQVTEAFNSNVVWTITHGTTAGKLEDFWTKRISLTNTQSKTYDLAGGATNSFGKVLTFTEVKWFQIDSDSANHGTVSMGNEIGHWYTLLGATNQTIQIPPGAQIIFLAPGTNNYAVTATTGDLLKFTNDEQWTNVIKVTVGGVVN